MTMLNRQQHREEVRYFIERQFSGQSWELELPNGSGNETYLVRNKDTSYFVKLGVQISKYQAMASLGLTPQVIAEGSLRDGTSVMVQPYLSGRNPSRKDYHSQLEQFAITIKEVHHSPYLIQKLPQVASESYKDAALLSLVHIQHKWDRYKKLVPKVNNFIDEGVRYLEQQISGIQGVGLVASHNDICNANWIITNNGQLYLIDLESMSIDDPAVDIGATLWWYYPPKLRERFLIITGHAEDKNFENRMHVRMAMHCLSILLPRENSFDQFDPDLFAESLSDFEALLSGKENPQGYED
jgi:thiamine kinase-like enzyme